MTKFKTVTIYLEHNIKKPMKKKLKTSGLRGMVFAGKLAKWIGQGYTLVKAEGDPEDPIYQYIQKNIDQYAQKGRVALDRKDIFQVAHEITGASKQAIQEKYQDFVNKRLKKEKQNG